MLVSPGNLVWLPRARRSWRRHVPKGELQVQPLLVSSSLPLSGILGGCVLESQAIGLSVSSKHVRIYIHRGRMSKKRLRRHRRACPRLAQAWANRLPGAIEPEPARSPSVQVVSGAGAAARERERSERSMSLEV